jgi:hypothetical protein
MCSSHKVGNTIEFGLMMLNHDKLLTTNVDFLATLYSRPRVDLSMHVAT